MEMFLKNRFKILLLTSLLSTNVAFAQSSPTTTSPATSVTNNASSSQVAPQAFVQNVVSEVLQILQANPILASGSSPASTNIAAALPQIVTVLSTAIDLKTMSEFLVPPAIWNAASQGDQNAFELALLNFMANLYGSALAAYNPQQYQVIVNPPRGNYANQSRIQINSTIVNNANSAGNVEVAFILESVGNSWQFLDFSINNSLSVASNVQAQIQSIIQNLQSNSSTPIPLSALTAIIVKHNNQPNIGN